MIAAAQTDATVQLLIPGDMRPSEYELVIRAELLAADNKTVAATTYTPVLRINVAPPPKPEPAPAAKPAATATAKPPEKKPEQKSDKKSEKK